jgi:hypothetical protein
LRWGHGSFGTSVSALVIASGMGGTDGECPVLAVTAVERNCPLCSQPCDGHQSLRVVKFRWDAGTLGVEYVSLEVGMVLRYYGVLEDGWAFGDIIAGDGRISRRGWYPHEFTMPPVHANSAPAASAPAFPAPASLAAPGPAAPASVAPARAAPAASKAAVSQVLQKPEPAGSKLVEAVYQGELRVFEERWSKHKNRWTGGNYGFVTPVLSSSRLLSESELRGELKWNGQDIFLHANDFWDENNRPLELRDGPVSFRVGSRRGKTIATRCHPL